MSLSPIGDIVLIAPAAIAGRVQVVEGRSAFRGRVLARGPKATEVEVGDIVHVSPGRAIEAVFDQRRTWITRAPELLAVEDGA